MKEKLVAKTTTARRRLKLGTLRGNIGYLTRVVRNVVRHSSSAFVGELGLATGQITLLGLIAANEGVSQNDLASAMLMRKSQVTGLIQDLVERDYVARVDMGADRRFNALSLTQSGKQVWRRARACITSHSDSVVEALNLSERDELMRLLCKVIAHNFKNGEVDFE
jgi:DNA-binding MarR family transcriptional regulator